MDAMFRIRRRMTMENKEPLQVLNRMWACCDVAKDLLPLATDAVERLEALGEDVGLLTDSMVATANPGDMGSLAQLHATLEAFLWPEKP